MNYQEAISYLEGLKIFGIRLGLTRIERLLELLDMPQDRYRTIHVTGTNGKGSVSAMVEGVLRRSGIHTGFYSSPHLVSYTERIRVDELYLPALVLLSLLSSLTAPIGARLAHKLPVATLKKVFAGLLIALSAKMLHTVLGG